MWLKGTAGNTKGDCPESTCPYRKVGSIGARPRDRIGEPFRCHPGGYVDCPKHPKAQIQALGLHLHQVLGIMVELYR